MIMLINDGEYYYHLYFDLCSLIYTLLLYYNKYFYTDYCYTSYLLSFDAAALLILKSYYYSPYILILLIYYLYHAHTTHTVKLSELTHTQTYTIYEHANKQTITHKQTNIPWGRML